MVAEGSHGNLLEYNSALDGRDNGFVIESNNNELKHNTSTNLCVANS